MADIGELRYLYTGRIEERDGSYVIEVPEREVVDGDLEEGEQSQIGIFGPVSGSDETSEGAATETADEPTDGDQESSDATDVGGAETTDEATEPGEADSGSGATASDDEAQSVSGTESLDEVEFRDPSEPPVDEGETRTVEIVDEGEQGDGLARIDRGYIVFVPGTEPGDTVEIRITDTKENFAFGEIVE